MCRGLGTCTGAISTAQLGSGNLLSHGNLPARGGVIERLSPFSASSVSLPSCQGSPSVALAPAAAGPPLARARGHFEPRRAGTPQWPWCPHLQLPTPRRRPCAGAGGGSPQMRGLGRSPSWWHLGSSGAVPGLAGDGEAPAPPAGGGHPSAGGDAGGASLPTGYRGSQDIELRWDVHFVHGGRWEKLRLGSCSHRDPLAGVGTAGAELPKPQGLFGVALEVQPCPGERLLHGRALPVAGTAPPARCSPLVPTFHPRVPQ